MPTLQAILDLGFVCYALTVAWKEPAKQVCSLKIDSSLCSSIQECLYELLR
jgi:hypothetical protein